ncbi:MAG: cytochrome-c oxidase, cbb3-type subunit I [Phycisphaerales bacterium JB043]
MDELRLVEVTPMADNQDQGNAGTSLERFSYDDAIVRKFFFVTVLWGVVGMLAGLVIAAQLAFPKLNMGIEWLSFGRLRPLHTNATIFAFAGNAIFTAVYYSTQRLCKTRMWSDRLSNLHFWGWQLIIVAAAVTLPLGITQGKEYAELEWPIDLAIAVVWLGFFGTNLIMTLVKRRERHIYVAIWFYLASVITVTVLHVFNNLWVPVMSGIKSYPIYAGAQDAFMQWWYGHNAVAFFLTTPFLGLMYYFLPKAAQKPVFSYRLSIVHFWSLVFIYIWAGPHHLHYTAIPAWASTLGMLFSVMLWMPSWGGMINGLLTLRGAWNRVARDPVLKFFVVGVTFYGMSTFEGPLLSVKSVNALSHYTDWTIAHVHGGTLGWNGFMTFGMLYWLAPRIFQTKLWSESWATAHFWIGTLGIVLYALPIYVAGITQGLMWRAFDETGRLAYPDFVETSIQLVPFYHARMLGGALYIVGVLLMCWNFYRTWKTRPETYEVPVHEAPALSRRYEGDTRADSRLHANIEFGHKGDKFLQGHWHRTWERKPVKLSIWILVAVGVASLFEIIPTFLIKSNVPTIASVQPYTPLELYGRDIYIAEGCYNCHSQMIRPIRAETERYGEYSKAGEFVYDHPFQWGSRRIGPDLHRVGGKYSHHWHYLHFEDPQTFAPGSMMPQYTWFKEKDIRWGSIQPRVDAMLMLGVPYGEFARGGAEDAAREQARQIATELADQAQDESLLAMENKDMVAIIAYLQRLGTDIFKPAPEGTEPAPETAEEAH